jgi:cell wall-associated NlpC family hydrolase
MATVTSWQREIVDLVNKLRTERGLTPLSIDASLQEAAAWRAEDMLSRNYFSSNTPPLGPREPARPEGPPSAVIERFGYVPENEWTCAESILVCDLNDGGAVSAVDVFNAWRECSVHLQNMIGETYQAIGIGGPAGIRDGQNELPMAGVCVVEYGSEVVTPVGESEKPKFFLPRQEPPSDTPNEPRDLAERVAIAQASGKRIGPIQPARLGPSVATGDREEVTDSEAEERTTGRVRTPAPWGSFNCDWSDINRWDDILNVAANEFGVPFKRIKAHVVIESQGIPTAIQRNPRNGDSYGLMQIVPYGVGWDGWHATVRRLAGRNGDPADMLLNDPKLNVRVGAYILGVQKANYGTWDQASSAFFLGNPDWIGGDKKSGATGQKYRQALYGLMEEMGADSGTGTSTGTGTGTGPVTSAPTPGTGAALVAEALTHVGKQYVWATAGPNTFDCSGLVYYCYEQVTGKDLDNSYRDSHLQFNWGDGVDPTRARPGDLVFYDTANGTECRLGNCASHVGIYGGGNNLINALNPTQGVLISDLSTNYWTSRWIGTRRVLPTG